MGTATITGILQRVEVVQVIKKDRRIPWLAVGTLGAAIAFCFLFGCWQRFEAMQFNYENQQWEATKRELTTQRERLLLERSTKESASSILQNAQRIGMVTRASTLTMVNSPAGQTVETQNSTNGSTSKSAGGIKAND